MSAANPIPNNDLTTPSFWRQVSPGDIVILSDERTLKEKMAAGLGVGDERRSIGSIRKIEIRNQRQQRLAEYIIIAIGMPEHPHDQYIVAKLVDQVVGLSLYQEADDWEPTTRKGLLEQDCTFLWEPPEGDWSWSAKDLKYIEQIKHDQTGVEYILKPQGELSGVVSYLPGRDGADRHVGTIAEYVAAEGATECHDSEMAVVEIGEGDNGLIQLLVGRPLSLADVEVLNKGRAE